MQYKVQFHVRWMKVHATYRIAVLPESTVWNLVLSSLHRRSIRRLTSEFKSCSNVCYRLSSLAIEQWCNAHAKRTAVYITLPSRTSSKSTGNKQHQERCVRTRYSFHIVIARRYNIPYVITCVQTDVHKIKRAPSRRIRPLSVEALICKNDWDVVKFFYPKPIQSALSKYVRVRDPVVNYPKYSEKRYISD